MGEKYSAPFAYFAGGRLTFINEYSIILWQKKGNIMQEIQIFLHVTNRKERVVQCRF